MGKYANVLAATAALAVLAIGIAEMSGDWTVDDPSTTTTVVNPAVQKGEDTRKTTTVTTRQNNRTTSRVTTVEDAPGAAAQPEETVETTVEGGQTAFERVLGDGGLVLLRLGALVLVAFLAGAIVQRMFLGQYAIKVGGLELPAVAAGTAAEGLDALGQKIDAVEQARKDHEAVAKADLAVLYARLAALEQKPGR